MNGISFQALPRLGFAFRYGGQGQEVALRGRANWDRSFDAHFHCLMKASICQQYLGLRDFIGTGWYSSEYIVGTKSIGNLRFP